MKKKKKWHRAYGLWLMVLAICFMPYAISQSALGQVSTTPNLGLSIINPGTQNWGPIVNQNFVILDSKVPTLNMSCADGQVPAWAGGKFSICTTPTTAIDQAANYNWTGTHAFAKALTITGKQVCLADGTNCPSAGKETDPVIAALNGFVVSNGTTPAARSLATANANNITITNLTGAGNPTWDVGPNVALTSRSFAPTTGAWNFAAASSFTIKQATNYVPASDGQCGEDTVSFRLKCNLNGVVYTLAHLSEIQPVSPNLTAFSGLTGAAAMIPYFTAAGAMANAQMILCVNSGGNVLHVSSLSPLTFTCDASATGGLSGGTNNQALFATGATTFASLSDLTRSAGGVIQMPNGIEVGNVANGWQPDGTAYAGHGMVTVAVPYVGAGGSFVLSTGALTTGHSVVVGANGQLIDTGGAAGTGTWTDSSTSTGTNKTLVATGAGGTNTITLPLVASFDGGSITASSGCQDPVKIQINSGPQEYAVLCSTPASAQWSVKVPMLKQAVTTFIVRIEVNDSVSSSHVYAGTVKAQCRASGAAPSSTWGTTQTISATMVTASNTYQAASAAVTANGTCAADADLYVQFDASGSMTDTGTARLIGVRIFQAS